MAEALRSLVEKKQLSAESARRWVDYLRLGFPAGRIDLNPHIPDVPGLTRDPADAHVCALVVAARADYLFTHDRGYLRDSLNRHGVQVLAPDGFLTGALDFDTRGVLEILELQASTWAGGHAIGELLDAQLSADESARHARMRVELGTPAWRASAPAMPWEPAAG